jgi:hypothetical protein
MASCRPHNCRRKDRTSKYTASRVQLFSSCSTAPNLAVSRMAGLRARPVTLSCNCQKWHPRKQTWKSRFNGPLPRAWVSQAACQLMPITCQPDQDPKEGIVVLGNVGDAASVERPKMRSTGLASPRVFRQRRRSPPMIGCVRCDSSSIRVHM